MKRYWDIPGPSKAPQSHCMAFHKYDGSNLRFGWSRKRGWYKFGTRNYMMDETHPDFGEAIPLFMKTYGNDLEKVFKDSKAFRGVDEAIVYCEFFGKNSFAGWHMDEPKELVLFDVCVHKRGIMPPKQFVKEFGHLKIAEVVYEGNFNIQFVRDVKSGVYENLNEGVVAKGIIQGKKNQQHGLWMAKVKTESWLNELKGKSEIIDALHRAWVENNKEQVFKHEKDGMHPLRPL